jgi:hypothetical protein
MQQAKFSDQMKSTAVCTKRLTKHSVHSEENIDEEEDRNINECWLGAAWFADLSAVKGVAEHGDFISTLKTNHSQRLKKHLETTMKDWAAGSHLILETNYEGVLALAIGHKHNKRKVVCFIAKNGAGGTLNLVSVARQSGKMTTRTLVFETCLIWTASRNTL